MASAADPSSLVIKIRGVFYPIKQLLDKTIYAPAGRPVKMYHNGYEDRATLQINAGQPIGKVFSWITTTNGVFFMIESNNAEIKKNYLNGTFFVKVTDVDDTSIKDQGAKTQKEVTEEEKQKQEYKDKSFSDKALEGAMKLGTIAIVALVGSSLLKGFISSRSSQ